MRDRTARYLTMIGSAGVIVTMIATSGSSLIYRAIALPFALLAAVGVLTVLKHRLPLLRH